MKCTKCNSELTIGERFCGQCGTPRPATHAKFISVEDGFLEIKKRFRDGTINKSEFTTDLQRLILTSENGDHWMIGEESEKWHRFNGQEWIPSNPPSEGTDSPLKGKGKKPTAETETIEGKHTSPFPTRKGKPEKQEISKPAKKSGRGCLGISTGVLLVLVALCGALVLLGVVFRQELVNKFASIAVKKGWGQVAPPENPTEYLQPSMPAALPTEVKAQVESAASSWEKAACPAANVQAGIPPGFTFFIEEEKNGYFRGEDPLTGLSMDCLPAAHSGKLEIELEYWLSFQSSVSWQNPLYGNTAVGPMAWTEGTFEGGDPVFTALVGPTRDGYILTFWGLGDISEWDRLAGLFQQVVESLEYTY